VFLYEFKYICLARPPTTPVFSDWNGKKLFLPTFAFLFFTLFFLFARSGFTAQVTLAWDPNTEVNLAGYRIYYKTSAPGAPYDGVGANEGDSPIDVPLALLNDEDNPEYKLTGLSDTRTYYLVATAYDDDLRESDYSEEVSYRADSDGGCFIVTAGF
jgi:hypothetical protein